MSAKNPQPPRWADRLLELFCAPHLLEEIQGDLYERFQRQVQLFGPRSARQQYIWAVLSFLKPFALKRKPKPYSNPSLFHPAMLQNQFKIAWRKLWNHKATAAINLLGLTLGISACLVLGVVIHFELSFDRFHPDQERIYRVVGQAKFGKESTFNPIGFVPRAVPASLREEVKDLETVASFHNLESNVAVPQQGKADKVFPGRDMDKDPAQIIVAEQSYFSIFKYQWLAGNPEGALTEPYRVVLTEPKARLYFGAGDPQSFIGRELIYRDSIRMTVSGIVAPWTERTDLGFTDFLSAPTIRVSRLKNEINLDEWNDIWSASQLFVKLAPKTAEEQASAQLKAFGKRHFGPKAGTGDFVVDLQLQPLSDLHFNPAFMDNYSRKAHLPTLYGLTGVALFILIIAAINFINLSTAQASQRSREVGMRKVLGSSRWSLIGQFMSETLILTLIALVVALTMANPILHIFQSFIPAGIHFTLLNPTVLLYLLGITLVTVFLAGFYPAIILSAYRPAIALKGATALAGSSRSFLRRGLIVFQFTVSLIFIIGTLMVGRQLNFMRNKDLGFSTDQIITLNTPRGEKSLVLAEKVRQIAGVKQVATQWAAPLSQNYALTKLTYNQEGKKEIEVSAKIGDANFIPMYQLKLVAGRNYYPSDTLRELVINQSLAKMMGFKQEAESIGQLLNLNGRDYPVVGVVADFHENTMHQQIKPTFIAYLPNMSGSLGIKLSAAGQSMSEIQATLSKIQSTWNAVFPDDKKFEYTFLDDAIDQLYSREQKLATLVNTAAAIAVLISCLGLLGLATFTAEQRTKEIGVRKVLGASISSIVLMLSRDFVLLVGIAILIGSPIAWWGLRKWLDNFAYRVQLEWWVFALAGIMAVGIALLTVSFQSLKAAIRNPVESLKGE